MRQALLGGVVRGALDLVVVVVEAGDVGAGELGDLAGGAANTAPDVEDLHPFLDPDLVGEVVLVAGNGLVEVLAAGVPAEVERLAPAILVEIRGEVIVTRGGIVCQLGGAS